jgi:hypothetical protein
MDSQKQQQLQHDIQSELSNNQNNCDPNFIDSQNAVLKKTKAAFTMTVTSDRTCGYDEDGNWVCKT